MRQTWHSLSIEVIFNELKANVSGLSESEVLKRQKMYGLNSLPSAPKQSAILRFLLQFHNILIYVLLASAAITLLTDHLVDALVILAVVVANAIIGFIQEGKAENAMGAIRHMLAPKASVLRGGRHYSIDGEKLVPGDIVFLRAGDKVPADLRLLEVHGLKIQESILTGESVPVEKNIKTADALAMLGDRFCMAFSGTMVTSGQAKGIVVSTGLVTEIGTISQSLFEVQTLTTPLVRQMNVLAHWLTFFILSIAALLFIFGYFVIHYPFEQIFMTVVSLAVSAIPEGLPAVLSITLAIGVQAMVRRNVIVRRLPAIETLGSVSVICTDKTGTLTENEMMVASVVTANNFYKIEGKGYEPKGEIWLGEVKISSYDCPELKELARVGSLCNDAELREHEGTWKMEGDPTEGALLAFSGKIYIGEDSNFSNWTRIDTIPFDSEHGFMATLHSDHESQKTIFVKGAPEYILSMCKEQLSSTGETEFLDEIYWEKKADEIAIKGQRVLAFAQKRVTVNHSVLAHADIEGTLVFVGMVGMIDPPRKEAIDAIAQCHRAGIFVKMITGDHVLTASAIGRQIGLINTNKVLTGADIDKMDDLDLAAAVVNVDIFARTSPAHKLRLVMALQSHNLTVAMTGDGVNDTPALKRADVGVAMGHKGSEAAKEASEIVLIDDNFASIVAAVREGRTVYDNIKKVISWTLPTNAGEAIIIVVALLLGIVLPMSPLQILWINLVTAITLGLALAFEPTEEGAMKRMPRPRDEPLLTRDILWHILLVSVLFLCAAFGLYLYAVDRGYSLKLARTIVCNAVVSMEIFHLLFIRNFYATRLSWNSLRGTKILWMTIAMTIFLQLAFTYWSFFQDIFQTETVHYWDMLLVFGVGMFLFIIIEIEKQLRLRFRMAKIEPE